MTAADASDAKISALDAKELLQRADLADETEEVRESHAFQAFVGTVNPKQVRSFCTLPTVYEGCTADDKLEAAVARADMGFFQHRIDEIGADQAWDGLLEAYAPAVGDDTLEVAMARADMRTLLNRAALRTLVRQVAFPDVEVERTWAVGLPAAYATLASDDKLEAVLARMDAEELHERSVVADMPQDSWAVGLPQAYIDAVLDDQYQATLTTAHRGTLQRTTDAAEPAPKMITIDDIPKAYAAAAANDELEVRLAFADMIDVQARADAEGDIMEQQLWAAGLPKAFEDAVEKGKLEAVSASNDMHSLQNRTNMEQEHVRTSLLPEALIAAAENDKHEAALAFHDKKECQKCIHPLLQLPASPNFADSCEEGVVVGNQSVKWQKTIEDWSRQESQVSTTVPDDFATDLYA